MSSSAPSADLLRWYDRHRRPLPWRENTDPYRVWLSEVMLQQTRVDVVIPYYERFLEHFPSVEELAAAEVDEVLALWSGLGYYRRARQLHAAAREVTVGGEGFPATAEGLRALPGIGDYTAAAVASISFGEPVPVLDGNVERVLCRLHGIDADPKRAATRRRLRELAADLLEPERPGDSNQALMELGATVCTPAAPACLLCPLSDACTARREGRPEAYPPPRKRRAPRRIRRVVALTERDGRRLLFKRGDREELLAGTWELPWVDRDAGSPGSKPAAAVDVAGVEAELGRRYGGRWRLGEPVARVRHSITHRAFEVEVRPAELVDGGGAVAEGPEGAEAGWFREEEVAGLATSSLVTKVLARRRPTAGDRG